MLLRFSSETPTEYRRVAQELEMEDFFSFVPRIIHSCASRGQNQSMVVVDRWSNQSCHVMLDMPSCQDPSKLRRAIHVVRRMLM